MLQTFYFLVAAYTTKRAVELTVFHENGDPREEGGPWYMKATWLLQSVVLNGSFLCFMMYWCVVYPNKAGPVAIMQYFVHGANFFLMLVDAYFTNQPYYLMHGLYYFGYLSLYVLFSVIFWAAGGTDCTGKPYVYNTLDWNKPGAAGTYSAILLYIIVPASCTLMFTLVSWFMYGEYRYGPHEDSEAAPMTGRGVDHGV